MHRALYTVESGGPTRYIGGAAHGDTLKDVAQQGIGGFFIRNRGKGEPRDAANSQQKT